MKSRLFVLVILALTLSTTATAGRSKTCPSSLIVVTECSQVGGSCQNYWQCSGATCTSCDYDRNGDLKTDYKVDGAITGVCKLGRRTCSTSSD